MEVMNIDKLIEMSEKDVANKIAEDEREAGIEFSGKEKAIADLYMTRGVMFIVKLIGSGALTIDP